MGASCVRPPGLFSLGMKMMISISRADWLVRLLMTKRRGRKVPPTNEAEPQEEKRKKRPKKRNILWPVRSGECSQIHRLFCPFYSVSDCAAS